MIKPKKKRPSDPNMLAASVVRDVEALSNKPMEFPPKKSKSARPKG